MWFLILVLLVGTFALGAFLGAPYLPTRQVDVEQILDLANLKPGERIIDLGAGDGRLLVAAAKRGVRSIGYEINPLLYLVCLWRIWPYRQLASVRLANFWRVSLPPAEAIFTFLIDHYMKKLDSKLLREIKTQTKVITYVFDLPGRKPVLSTKNARLYIYPNS